MDWANYSDRFSRMFYQCGPGSWQYLLASRAEVAAAASGKGLRDQRLAATRLHPDTRAPIPLPFCMAAHVPVNAGLLLGMLTARGALATGCWQAANQLFNAAQFYANRNATNAISDERLLLSLAGSTASAVLVASGLTLALARGGGGGGAGGAALLAAVPFLGATAAKPLQIGLLRADECVEGVEVFGADGAALGRSAAAGRRGVAATIATRVLYLAPMLWMPYAQRALERAVPLLQRSRAAALASYLAHAALNSSVVTPACIALFEQRQAVDGDELEACFHGRGTVYFNKGL